MKTSPLAASEDRFRALPLKQRGAPAIHLAVAVNNETPVYPPSPSSPHRPYTHTHARTQASNRLPVYKFQCASEPEVTFRTHTITNLNKRIVGQSGRPQEGSLDSLVPQVQWCACKSHNITGRTAWSGGN